MIINNINIFEPTNIVELRDSLSALYPHNLIFNYFYGIIKKKDLEGK